jgi:hypothetical protein
MEIKGKGSVYDKEEYFLILDEADERSSCTR